MFILVNGRHMQSAEPGLFRLVYTSNDAETTSEGWQASLQRHKNIYACL